MAGRVSPPGTGPSACLSARQLLGLLGHDYAGGDDKARLRLLQMDLKALVDGGRIEVANPGGRPLLYRRCGVDAEDAPILWEYTLHQIQDLVSEVIEQRQLSRLWERLLNDADGPVLDAGRLRIVPDTLRLQPVELNHQTLLAVLTASANRQAIQVLYKNAMGERSEPCLHAQALVQRGPIPYLFALKNEETEPVRLYALHRMIRAKVLPEVPARQAAGFDLDQAIEKGLVDFGQGDWIELELRVRGYLTEVLKACPLGPGQRWTDEPDDSEFDIRVWARVPSTGQLLRRLLGAGDNIVTVRLSGSLLEMEAAILEASNAVGRCGTEEALKRFDTDGSPIRIGEMKLTARGRDPKEYQTPYGAVPVERYVYQSWRGGRIDCPLEHQGRIVRGATPRFASQLSHKYAHLDGRAVQADLEHNHGRSVAASYIQNVAEWVGTIALAKEEDWEYAMPALEAPITTVVASLDGAMIPMADTAGYREAMVGTLSFYDHEGERQHSIYLAATPEYGKQGFLQRLEREILRAKQHFPEALYVGIADGAASNWRFLEQHTERQLIDFFHATEYVGQLAQASYPCRQGEAQRAQWQHAHCTKLKHDPAALDVLIGEAARLSQRQRLSQALRDGAMSAWTYFTSRRHQMDYPGFLAAGLPIGSGVTEAACKTLVKQRLCASGMRWKSKGAAIVLSLRALTQTAGRWTQFWQKIDQFGAECCG